MSLSSFSGAEGFEEEVWMFCPSQHPLPSTLWQRKTAFDEYYTELRDLQAELTLADFFMHKTPPARARLELSRYQSLVDKYDKRLEELAFLSRESLYQEIVESGQSKLQMMRSDLEELTKFWELIEIANEHYQQFLTQRYDRQVAARMYNFTRQMQDSLEALRMDYWNPLVHDLEENENWLFVSTLMHKMNWSEWRYFHMQMPTSQLVEPMMSVREIFNMKLWQWKYSQRYFTVAHVQPSIHDTVLTIIDCTNKRVENAFKHVAGLKYIDVAGESDEKPIIEEALMDQIMHEIQRAESGGLRVLIHGEQGSYRHWRLTCGVMMRRYGWSLDRTLQFFEKVPHVQKFVEKRKDELEAYEMTLSAISHPVHAETYGVMANDPATAFGQENVRKDAQRPHTSRPAAIPRYMQKTKSQMMREKDGEQRREEMRRRRSKPDAKDAKGKKRKLPFR
ncbi:unnamed protein product [Vitrella brassicaformis CCMP3155]|uniref:Tyrosine-protein phosphatase domain-containing protein n=2 Tax=Vitrella brassicaformis TaxID=1169539 RepID=A0A0G4FLB9_VITBC|nr:unnamed protein product [Vitrella brassicaformis CCMP3155]|eukprot:CEM14799.1 unnamed protein product [Vitrella brassicaformis CCMP3155]